MWFCHWREAPGPISTSLSHQPADWVLIFLCVIVQEELEFRRRNHFLISYAELSHEPPKHRNLLELAGDVTVREAVTKMIEWLGLPDATCHSVGLLWKSPSLLLEFDPPIMHWLPLDRKLRTFQFRPHEEIILQSIPQLFDHNKECSRNSIDIQQTLLFVTTPEVEKTVILAVSRSSPTLYLGYLEASPYRRQDPLSSLAGWIY